VEAEEEEGGEITEEGRRGERERKGEDQEGERGE
jgi:hypothetical protein